MAATAKSSTASAGLGAAAIQLALKAMQSEAVKEQLSRAPAAVVNWAADHRGGGAQAALQRINPADRFGQRGLERRLDHLDEAFTLTFGDRTSTSRPEMWEALDEIRRAIAVAAGLPTLKRKRMHLRIDNALDELEAGLIDAVMPKS
jgi:hypothetical protein